MLKKFFESYTYAATTFTVTVILMVAYCQPAHARDNLIYEQRAVGYQELNLSAASEQALQTIEEAKAVCASLGATLDPRQIRFKARSNVRNVIRRPARRSNGRRNTIYIGVGDIVSLFGGHRRPVGDYTNESQFDVTIGSRPCIMPKP